MTKGYFRELTIDERVLIINQFATAYKIWSFECQDFLTIQNPVIKIYADNICAFDKLNELHEFFFLVQSLR
jgi:hypothetical protein